MNIVTLLYMGEYGLNCCKVIIRKPNHFIIPHHLYDNIYKFDKGRNESCVKLKMLDNRINILCFGQFRTDEERDLILKLRKHKDMQNVNFIVPGFFRHRLVAKTIGNAFTNLALHTLSDGRR